MIKSIIMWVKVWNAKKLKFEKIEVSPNQEYYLNLLKKQAKKVSAKYFNFFDGYNFTADDGNEYQTIFNENLKSFIVRLWTGATYKTVAILTRDYYGEI